MTSPYGRMCVIVNPRAGRGAVDRGWPAVKAVIESDGLEYDMVITERAGHATDLARAAVEGGCRYVVAVGGDGTINEVINGLMDDVGPRKPDTVLGVVACGSGSDFVKTFGLPSEPEASARHLNDKTLWGKLDVGRVRFRTESGETAVRWFINVAEAGIGAHVVRTAARMPRALAGPSYRLAALKGILTFRPQEATCSLNGRSARGARRDEPLGALSQAGRFTMVVVANGQFFGGGLRVAPRAIPSDAMFDVLVGEGSRLDAARALQRMPRGEHVPSATITEYLADSVTVDGPIPLAVEADGEWLGTTPATFDLVPAAIALKI